MMERDSPLGGIFQMDQARGLTKNGVSTGLLAPCPVTLMSLFKFGYTKSLNRVSTDVIEDVRVYKVNKPILYPARFFKRRYKNSFLRIGIKLWKRYVASYGMPDVIHAHNAWCAGLLAREIREKFDFKGSIILTEHDSNLAAVEPGLLRPEYFDAYRAADVLVSVSAFLGKKILDHFPDLTASVRIIPNVLDKQFYSAPLSKRALINEEVVIVNIGRLVDVKDHKLLIRAFAYALQKKSNLRLRIIGHGPLEAELLLMNEYLENRDKIEFLGYLDRSDIIKELSRSDFFVLSSKHETFGVAIIEAHAMGLPTVAFKGSGPDDIINESNGLLIEDRSANSLGDAMVAMSENIMKYDPLQIRQHCVNRFSEESVSKQLLSIYQQR